MTAFELEEFIGKRGREVLLRLLQDHYDLQGMREEQRARANPGPDRITRSRLETGHGRALATLFGTVTVTRCAFLRRRPRGDRPPLRRGHRQAAA